MVESAIRNLGAPRPSLSEQAEKSRRKAKLAVWCVVLMLVSFTLCKVLAVMAVEVWEVVVAVASSRQPEGEDPMEQHLLWARDLAEMIASEKVNTEEKSKFTSNLFPNRQEHTSPVRLSVAATVTILIIVYITY